MSVNEKYKSSVFSALFSNPDVLRELYSAIEGIDIPPDMPIDINTLSNVLIKGQINDLSFMIDNRLVVLIEHQSSINNNMPLRLLLYIANIYQMIIDHKLVHQQKLIKIPTPEFIVLYNGKAPFPDRKEMKLSEAFKNVEGLKLPECASISLELIVRVYNINYGRNPEILRKSSILGSYSFFIEKIREFNKKYILDESVKLAIKYCIENDVLRQFLENNSSEIINMLLEEWNFEDALSISREEALEIGREEGLEIGREEGLERGREEGLEKGREEGLERGREEGLEKGREEGLERGREEGLEKGRREIAYKALVEGASVEFVQKITGLDKEIIIHLQEEI